MLCIIYTCTYKASRFYLIFLQTTLHRIFTCGYNVRMLCARWYNVEPVVVTSSTIRILCESSMCIASFLVTNASCRFFHLWSLSSVACEIVYIFLSTILIQEISRCTASSCARRFDWLYHFIQCTLRRCAGTYVISNFFFCIASARSGIVKTAAAILCAQNWAIVYWW